MQVPMKFNIVARKTLIKLEKDDRKNRQHLPLIIILVLLLE